MNNLQVKRAKRFLYLKHLYELSGGDKLKLLRRVEVGQDLGWDNTETDEIVEYLRAEGLVKFITFGTVSITHVGIKSIERALSHPELPTDRFPPASIIVVVNCPYSAHRRQAVNSGHRRHES